MTGYLPLFPSVQNTSGDGSDEQMIDAPEPLLHPSGLVVEDPGSLFDPPQPLVCPQPAAVSRTAYATNADWENHRSDIEDLYLKKGKKLKDVKATLETRYGFIAT